MQLAYSASMPFEVLNYCEYHNYGPVVVILCTLFDSLDILLTVHLSIIYPLFPT